VPYSWYKNPSIHNYFLQQVFHSKLLLKKIFTNLKSVEPGIRQLNQKYLLKVIK